MKVSLAQIIIFVILVAAIAGGAVYYVNSQGKGGVGNKERQAIFLTNGQVYFGYVQNESAAMVKVTDVYYLQVQQTDGAQSKDGQQPQVSLVKLGNELHGPKDEMRINHDQILFVEDMKDDSKVNEAIKSFVANGGQPTAPVSPAASPSGQ